MRQKPSPVRELLAENSETEVNDDERGRAQGVRGPHNQLSSILHSMTLVYPPRSAIPLIHASISSSTHTVHLGPSERDLGKRPSLIRW